MQHPDGDIDERELARALAAGWGLVPAALRYAPVGFGDHHWELTDASGGRWFVTVAALVGRLAWHAAPRPRSLADLRAALSTGDRAAPGGPGVRGRTGAGLQAGQPLAPLGPGHAVTVYPWLDGAAGHFLASRC